MKFSTEKTIEQKIKGLVIERVNIVQIYINNWQSEALQTIFRNQNLSFVAYKSCYIYTLSKI